MKRNKLKKWLILFFVFLLIILLLARRMGILGATDSISVAVEPVRVVDIIESVVASGKIQPRVDVRISPDVSGEVVEVYVKEGDYVRKGDKLVRIKPDQYESYLEQIEANYQMQQAQVASAKSRLAQARARLYQAKVNYERTSALYQEAMVSKSEHENAWISYEVAVAEVEASEYAVQAAEFQLKSLEASLKEARINLQRTIVYAPTDGTIYQLHVKAGERVAGASQFSPGTELLRIANLQEMELLVRVNENDVVKIHPGDSVLIEVDAYQGVRWYGLVSKISFASAVNTLQQTEQLATYDVIISIFSDTIEFAGMKQFSQQFILRPGMSATAEIITAKAKQVLAVPLQSVTNDKDALEDSLHPNRQSSTGYIVYVYADGKAQKRKITLGLQDTYYAQIMSGLSEGEEVIVAPYSAIVRKLKDGSPVKKVSRDKLFE